MKKTLIFSLLSVPVLFFSLLAEEDISPVTLPRENTQATTLLQAPKPLTAEEEEEWITDRDRGSRERPNLYDYNKRNVQYNNRYRDNDRGSYRYNQSSREDTFNRSYYDDNTSPDLYLNW